MKQPAERLDRYPSGLHDQPVRLSHVSEVPVTASIIVFGGHLSVEAFNVTQPLDRAPRPVAPCSLAPSLAIAPGFHPPLDPGFVPAALWNRAYRAQVGQAEGASPAACWQPIFPAFAERIRFHLPGEQEKRHGHAIAAASLPAIAPKEVPNVP
jgi:hypothetical protein